MQRANSIAKSASARALTLSPFFPLVLCEIIADYSRRTRKEKLFDSLKGKLCVKCNVDISGNVELTASLHLTDDFEVVVTRYTKFGVLTSSCTLNLSSLVSALLCEGRALFHYFPNFSWWPKEEEFFQAWLIRCIAQETLIDG